VGILWGAFIFYGLDVHCLALADGLDVYCLALDDGLDVV
jgi:hypothetical protein